VTLYTCTIPAIAPSYNEHQRWPLHRQLSEKAAFQMAVMAVLSEKGNKCPRGLQHVTLRAVVTVGPSWLRFACREGGVERQRDGDNYGSILAKWTQDQIVRCGVIPDDTPEYCTFILPPGIVVGTVQQTFLSIEGSHEI
jgi:hypothetical protein